ncbi:hypothetical protein PCL_09579 [Purpureocillium lilacinum]|uniref:Uncharacterized protein n=1 Tax=Purpureocillium lilacinum TaxID=33203 RepID=A0A2U3DQK3_PURLI|nr:hypothetical protein PCL_09579 [Purpureocillium lilacinum]
MDTDAKKTVRDRSLMDMALHRLKATLGSDNDLCDKTPRLKVLPRLETLDVQLRPSACASHPSLLLITPLGSAWTEREYEQIVNNFLSDVSFKALLERSNLDLQSSVEKRMASQGVSPIMIDRVKGCIKTGIKITALTYSFLSPAAQEAIATYASYVISIDDLTSELASAE